MKVFYLLVCTILAIFSTEVLGGVHITHFTGQGSAGDQIGAIRWNDTTIALLGGNPESRYNVREFFDTPVENFGPDSTDNHGLFFPIPSPTVVSVATAPFTMFMMNSSSQHGTSYALYPGFASPFGDFYNVLPDLYTRNPAAATADERFAILAGGANNTDNFDIVFVHDANIHDIVYSSSLDVPRCEMAAAGLSDGLMAFFAGGLIVGENPALSDVVTVVFAEGNWTHSDSLLTLSSPRAFGVGASWQDLVFFAGGATQLQPTVTVTDIVEVWNATTGEFESYSPLRLSVARSHLTATTYGDFIIFAGGATEVTLSDKSWQEFESVTESDVVDILHVPSLTWARSELSVPRFRVSSSALSTFALVSQGSQWNETYDDFEYFPDLDIYILEYYESLTCDDFTVSDDVTGNVLMGVSATDGQLHGCPGYGGDLSLTPVPLCDLIFGVENDRDRKRSGRSSVTQAEVYALEDRIWNLERKIAELEDLLTRK